VGAVALLVGSASGLKACPKLTCLVSALLQGLLTIYLLLVVSTYGHFGVALCFGAIVVYALAALDVVQSAVRSSHLSWRRLSWGVSISAGMDLTACAMLAFGMASKGHPLRAATIVILVWVLAAPPCLLALWAWPLRSSASGPDPDGTLPVSLFSRNRGKEL